MMGVHIEAQQAFGRCCQANDGCPCYFVRTIDDNARKIISNQLKQYAPQLDWNRVVGLIDITKKHTSTAGILVCDSKAYFYSGRRRPYKIWYDELRKITVLKTDDETSYGIRFALNDDTEFTWQSNAVDCGTIAKLIINLRNLSRAPTEDFARVIMSFDQKNDDVENGGLAASNRGVVNKLFDEERFHARQGHGFAAERANHLEDRLHGKKARIEGDNNIKNGPDRSVMQSDGAKILIQSKYCATGTRSINGCFENNGSGVFRYLDSSGNPMIIEVASDTYEDAVRAMARKIENGQIPGVADPAKASEIVKPGNFTYQQARNIAKAGNVDSIIYDAKSGAVISVSAFGISAAITLAVSLWNGDEPKLALKNAAFSGLKVGGTALLTTVLASQISKSSISGLMTPAFQSVAKTLSPKVYAALANAFRNGSTLTGAAAINSAAKLLKGNVISAAVTAAVLSMFDIKDVVRGRISGSQMVANAAKTTTTVIGGTAGWIGGSAAGTIVLPGVGTVVGGLIGSLVAGSGISVLVDKVTGKFRDSDAEKMIQLIQEAFFDICEEYLLGQDEAEKVSDNLAPKINEKTLKMMHVNKNRYCYAKALIEPLALLEVEKRPTVGIPSESLIEESIDAAIVEIVENLERFSVDEQRSDTN